MGAFLRWYHLREGTEGLLRAGLADLRFATDCPFEDGNGRTSRAISDQALAQSEESGRRFNSVPSQIRK